MPPPRSNAYGVNLRGWWNGVAKVTKLVFSNFQSCIVYNLSTVNVLSNSLERPPIFTRRDSMSLFLSLLCRSIQSRSAHCMLSSSTWYLRYRLRSSTQLLNLFVRLLLSTCIIFINETEDAINLWYMNNNIVFYQRHNLILQQFYS